MTMSVCPLCAPRPDDSPLWLKVASLATSTLYLDRNQTYPGHCQLIYDVRHVEGLELLEPAEYTAQMSDLQRAAQAISSAFTPDRMNYASMGNLVAHLHWHIVPRYRSDARWGKPIYTSDLADMPVKRLEEGEYQQSVDRIRAQLERRGKRA
jgi:diadenosine tetraphosphate (Ap4A) HIT family hydrolase